MPPPGGLDAVAMVVPPGGVLESGEQRHVEVWRRRGAKWETEDLIGDAELVLDALQSPIPLADLYAKVDL